MQKDGNVECPSCSASVPYAELNAHLDRCLGLTSQSAPPSNTAPIFGRPSERKRTGTNLEPPQCAQNAHNEQDTAKKRSKVEETPHSNANEPPHRNANEPQRRNANEPPHRIANASSSKERLDSVMPLAERLRPKHLDDFVGQEAVVNGPLKALLSKGIVPNAILWGPPGTGKTTLARVVAKAASEVNNIQYRFVEVSATTTSSNDVKKIFDESSNRLQLLGQRTILFVDEIQRFSRAQQDVFLPVIEKGLCILLAATTENPSFRLQGALLSRMRVFVLTKLSVEECFQVLLRARKRAQETEPSTPATPYEDIVDDTLLRWIANMADGDARTALGAMEIALATLDADASSDEKLSALKANLKRTSLQYDRTGDHHYDTISALHKSIRGSNADAALYWLVRMIESGDDPLFISRRLIVAASEDCGTLESLQMANATYQACQVVGLPECAENLAHCVVFLAESSKSTRAYRGLKKAQKLVREAYNYPVPIHIRNAPTKLMKDLGHGREYRYEPSFAHPVHQEYFPPELRGTRLLSPPPSSSRCEDDDALLKRSESPNRDGENTAMMERSDGVGPGACQRIFQLGARAVDLDLLDEWEREQNDNKPWKGRARLVALVANENDKLHSRETDETHSCEKQDG